MLMMDERNFHCWNYRLLTALLYLKEIPLRLDSIEASDKAEVEFLNKECEMAEKLIKKNFSNYSAWHYRSKLMPELYTRLPNEGPYLIPFEKIQDDLALLKHAFFTDPKDQSPWNYHEWLISLLSPVQVVSLTVEDGIKVVIGLSSKVRDFGQ
jgi:geranylgeranyl transferase type-2 subunit alpha